MTTVINLYIIINYYHRHLYTITIAPSPLYLQFLKRDKFLSETALIEASFVKRLAIQGRKESNVTKILSQASIRA